MKKLDITRKIVNSLCVIMCTITAFLLITFFISDNEKTVKDNISTPLPTPEIKKNGYKIVVDAGHGGKDGGAVGVGGTVEAVLNLEVAKELQTILLKQGYEVIMTRENEDALGATKMEDMKKRREIMNTDEVDAVISIHMNIFNDSSVNGPMVFYAPKSQAGNMLAENVISAICSAIKKPLRSSNPGDYFVTRESIPPAIIVECGFLSNSMDEKQLLSPDYRRTLAQGIADGLSAFFNI